jgi:hypothetical protein
MNYSNQSSYTLFTDVFHHYPLEMRPHGRLHHRIWSDLDEIHKLVKFIRVPHSKSTISGRFTELCIPAYTNRKSWQNIDFGCVHHCERIKIWTFVFPRIHGSPKITGFKNTNRSVLLNGRKCVCRYTLYVQCICTQQWLLYIYPLIHSSFSFES